MKATTEKVNINYEVEYSRPDFSRIGQFLDILEPIYDVLSKNLSVPSDAIVIDNGNSIASTRIIVSLFSGNWIFESRLDGYKVQISGPLEPEHFDFAIKCARDFSRVASRFISGGTPKIWQLGKSSWLNIHNNSNSAVNIVNQFNPYGDNPDPFDIDSTKTESLINFECSNLEKFWRVSFRIENSVIPEASLFYGILATYIKGSKLEDMDSQIQHLNNLSDMFSKKLNLKID